MQRWIVVLGLLVPSVAHADRPRAAALTVHGGFAVMGDSEAVGPDRMGSLLAASIGWDRPAPDFPEERGTARARGDLVPELTLVALGDRGAALAGARLELDLAQRNMGIFQMSARMSMWFGGRVGVIDEGGSPIYGGDFGSQFYLGRSDWRIGYDIGILTWREREVVDVPQPVGEARPIPFRVGDPGTQQMAILISLLVSR